MLMYLLIGVSLVLLGIAGLQFMYIFYIDRLCHERVKYLRSVERKCTEISAALESAERRVADQDQTIESLRSALDIQEEEIWADLIEDR